MTEQNEEIYISKETFPAGTVVLVYDHNMVMKEWQCLQWSEKGNCKIYDVLENKIFWAYQPCNYILETLPTPQFHCRYDFITGSFKDQAPKVEVAEDENGIPFTKDGKRLYTKEDFNPLYNLSMFQTPEYLRVEAK